MFRSLLQRSSRLGMVLSPPCSFFCCLFLLRLNRMPMRPLLHDLPLHGIPLNLQHLCECLSNFQMLSLSILLSRSFSAPRIVASVCKNSTSITKMTTCANAPDVLVVSIVASCFAKPWLSGLNESLLRFCVHAWRPSSRSCATRTLHNHHVPHAAV